MMDWVGFGTQHGAGMQKIELERSSVSHPLRIDHQSETDFISMGWKPSRVANEDPWSVCQC